MATTSVRLDDDEALLDLLAAERMRRPALADLLAEWDDGRGVTDDEVDEMTRRSVCDPRRRVPWP